MSCPKVIDVQVCLGRKGALDKPTYTTTTMFVSPVDDNQNLTKIISSYIVLPVQHVTLTGECQ